MLVSVHAFNYSRFNCCSSFRIATRPTDLEPVAQGWGEQQAGVFPWEQGQHRLVSAAS